MIPGYPARDTWKTRAALRFVALFPARRPCQGRGAARDGKESAVPPLRSEAPLRGDALSGPLLRQPAGPFFAVAALFAAAAPWPWLLHWPDAALLHLRLGIFGMGGAAAAGYLMTAQRAWTGRALPLPALWLAALWLAGRAVSLVWPGQPWLAAVSALVAGAALLWPILAARTARGLPAVLFVMAMGPAEAALAAGMLPPDRLATLLAILLALVGGKAVPAFLLAEAQRRGWPAGPQAPGAGLGAAALVLAHLPELRAGMLLLAALWCLTRLHRRSVGRLMRHAPLSAAAMLVWSWALFAAGLVAAGTGIGPPAAATHLLTLGAAGGMIFAISARAAMRRCPHRGLVASRLQKSGFALLLAATGLRLAAGAGLPLTLAGSGLCWSAAWLCHLAAHGSALMRPCPWPVLSAPGQPRQTQRRAALRNPG